MDHRILCIEEEQDRIVALGTGGDDGVAHRRWLASEVHRAIEEGDRFYVVSPHSGSQADLCTSEGLIAGAVDETARECLRGLRSCRWR